MLTPTSTPTVVDQYIKTILVKETEKKNFLAGEVFMVAWAFIFPKKNKRNEILNYSKEKMYGLKCFNTLEKIKQKGNQNETGQFLWVCNQACK